MRYVLLFTIALTLAACAKEDGAAEGCQSDHPLFRNWSHPDTGAHYNICGSHFGKTEDVPYRSNGKTCSCTIQMGGFIDFGQIEIRLCSIGGYMSDPDCDALNSDKRYRLLLNGVLEVCLPDGTGCLNFIDD